MAYYVDVDLSNLLFDSDSFIEHDSKQCDRIYRRTIDAFCKARFFLVQKYNEKGLEFDLFMRSYRAYYTLGALDAKIKYCYEFEYFEKGTVNSLGTFEILI